MEFDQCIHKIREANPLVHNITNQVVANDAANALLAIGASPIMAHAVEEVEEVVALADALVLNLGTPTKQTIKSMVAAGVKANSLKIPVVFDPVGVSATKFRQSAADTLFKAVKFSVIRGNAAEIASLIGIDWKSKGVDAKESNRIPIELAEKCAREKKCIVAISGEVDTVTDGKTTYRIKNGDALLGRITGSGCMLSAVTGAFVAGQQSSESDDTLNNVIWAHTAFGIAAENAVEAGVAGPGTFRAAFIDALANLTDEDVKKKIRIERISE